MAKENLFALKQLVQHLEDRDSNLKRDMSLYEAAFHKLPVPVAIWSSNSSGLCESCRVTGAPSPGWSEPNPDNHVFSLYHCHNLREQLRQIMPDVLSGNDRSFICKDVHSDTCIWTYLQPRRSPGGDCVDGVTGISVDITTGSSLMSRVGVNLLGSAVVKKEGDNVE